MTFRKRVSDNIRSIRIAGDISQTELARRTGKSLIYIKKLEAGEMNFTARVVDDMAAALVVPVDELVCDPLKKKAV